MPHGRGEDDASQVNEPQNNWWRRLSVDFQVRHCACLKLELASGGKWRQSLNLPTRRALLRTHQVQQGTADRQVQEIVDDIKHDEVADLSPDFRLVSRSDVEQERIKHLARIVASQKPFKAAADGGKGDLSD